MISSKKAYSVSEIVSSTGLGKTYVYSLIKSGQLLAKKVGKRTIVLDGDLSQYLNSLPNFKVNSSEAA